MDFIDISEGFSFENEVEESTRENFSEFEKATLMEIIRDFRSVIESKQTGIGAKNKKDEAWKKAEKKFCAVPGVRKRNMKQLKTWWANRKKRAKKDITRVKRAVKGTGGGPKFIGISHETEEVMALVPSQLQPLDNPFDSDGYNSYSLVENTEEEQEVAGNSKYPKRDETEDGNLLDSSSSVGGIISNAIPSTVGTVSAIGILSTPETRNKRNPRSALVDMEHQEHLMRMKTLAVEYETALTKQRINIIVMEFEEER